MRPENEYKVVAIVGHIITIIPAFLLAWQMGVLALLFWGIIDLIAYLYLGNNLTPFRYYNGSTPTSLIMQMVGLVLNQARSLQVYIAYN